MGLATGVGVCHPGIFAARVRKALRTDGLGFLAEPRVGKLLKIHGGRSAEVCKKQFTWFRSGAVEAVPSVEGGQGTRISFSKRRGASAEKKSVRRCGKTVYCTGGQNCKLDSADGV